MHGAGGVAVISLCRAVPTVPCTCRSSVSRPRRDVVVGGMVVRWCRRAAGRWLAATLGRGRLRHPSVEVDEGGHERSTTTSQAAQAHGVGRTQPNRAQDERALNDAIRD